MKLLLVLSTLAAAVLVWSVYMGLTAPEPPRVDRYGYAVSDECTEEDLEDGVCYTYDDIRNLP